jgi:hypothetical protein
MVCHRLKWSIIAVLSALCCAAAAQDNDQSWKNLSELKHLTRLILVTKERHCAAGSLESVGYTDVTVKLLDGTTATFHRADLLRVNRGAWSWGLLFSNRSSWLDVTILPTKRPKFPTRVRVETKDGQKYEGTLTDASDDGLTLQSGGKTTDLQKSVIATVSYIIQKPASDSAIYMDEEGLFLKFFDPELWPYFFGVEGSWSIKLYDASLPEDDSQIVCQNNPWDSAGRPLNLTHP